MTTIGLYKKLFQIAAEKKLWLRVLGEVGPYPIWFVRNQDGLKNYPRLLIVGGFHGEEIAGPEAIIRWLDGFEPQLYRKINLSFIPLVNPQGYNQKRRYNDKSQKSNTGFCHADNGDTPSDEGIILIKNAKLLTASAKNGFLSLHEDITSKKYYLYTFEHTPEPGPFTAILKSELDRFWPGQPLNEAYVTTDANGETDVFVKDGVVYKLCDGSCEDWLFHEGSLVTAATETPGTYPLNQRVKANQAIITKFIEQF